MNCVCGPPGPGVESFLTIGRRGFIEKHGADFVIGLWQSAVFDSYVPGPGAPLPPMFDRLDEPKPYFGMLSNAGFMPGVYDPGPGVPVRRLPGKRPLKDFCIPSFKLPAVS